MPNLFTIQLQKILLTSSSKQIRVHDQANNILVIRTFLVRLHIQRSYCICLVQALSPLHIRQPHLSPLNSFRKESDGEKCIIERP